MSCADRYCNVCNLPFLAWFALLSHAANCRRGVTQDRALRVERILEIIKTFSTTKECQWAPQLKSDSATTTPPRLLASYSSITLVTKSSTSSTVAHLHHHETNCLTNVQGPISRAPSRTPESARYHYGGKQVCCAVILKNAWFMTDRYHLYQVLWYFDILTILPSTL